MESSPRSINENTNPFNMSLITEDMKIYGPKEQQQEEEQQQEQEEERNYNYKRSRNELYQYNSTNNYSHNNHNSYINDNNCNNNQIHIQVNIHHEEYHENDLRYYLVSLFLLISLNIININIIY